MKNGETLTFTNADSSNFNHTINSDTVIIQQILYSGLDGASLHFSEQPNRMKLSYEIGFIQYTIDDNPAYPLETTFWTNPIVFTESKLPDHYGNHLNTQRTFLFLGYKSQAELANYFLKKYPAIKESSLHNQTTFYSNLLENNLFANCCPEYINQAKEFINKKPTDFNSLNDLAIELGFITTLLELNYDTGTQYIKIKSE